MNAIGSIANAYPRKVWTYIIDWVIVAAFIVGFSLVGNVSGYRRRFSLSDISIQYPFAVKERIPVWLLVIVAIVIPVVIMVIWVLVFPPAATSPFSRSSGSTRRNKQIRPSFDARLWDANLTLLGFALSIATALVITNAFKNCVGRPRPDLIDRCQPQAGSADASPYGLTDWTICTQTDLLVDGFRSFPSGHSSTAFAGLGYLSFFLAGRLNLLDHHGQVYKPAIVATPLVAAGLVAISRLMDYRHHPFDVMFGSLLGFLVAWMSYRQYFPSLAQTVTCGRPYSMDEFGESRDASHLLREPDVEGDARQDGI